MRLSGRGWFIGIALAAAVGTGAPYQRAAAQADINDLLVLPRAAERNDFDAILQMLQRGDPVDSEGDDNRAALSFAAANGDIKILDLLLDHRANPDHRDRFGDTALHWAAITGQIDAVKKLLTAHATVDMQNGQGVTPLMLAIANNRGQVVRILLAAGADVRIQDYTGHDALSWAQDKPMMLTIVQRAAR